MQIEIKDSGPCRKTVEISYTSEDIKSEFETMLSTYMKSVNLPGFRKGRAPRSLVKNKFTKKILEDLQEKLLGEGYRKAVKDHEISVLNILNVTGELTSGEQEVRFDLTLDVAPEFELPDYEKMPIEGQEVKLEDADLDKGIEDMLGRFATYEEVEGRAIELGDFVQVDYQGLHDGEPIEVKNEKFSGIVSGKEAWIPIEKESTFLPGFTEALIGCNIGDEKDIDVVFNDDFKSYDLGIDSAVYHATVTGIRSRKLPELNEEFLKQLGLESEEKLRENMSQSLLNSKEEEEHVRQINQVVENLLEKVTFDLPETVVQEETRQTIYEMVRANTQKGVDEDVIVEKKEEIFQVAERNAKEKLKLRYILLRIAEKEKIQVSQQEVASQIMGMALQQGMDPKEAQATMEKNNQMEGLKSQLRERKTLDFLVEKADVSMQENKGV